MVLSFNTATLRDADGNIAGATGTARDVTEQRRMEEAVAAKHLQLQSIIDNSPLVIYAKDADHRYVIANHELEAHLASPRAAPWAGRTTSSWRRVGRRSAASRTSGCSTPAARSRRRRRSPSAAASAPTSCTASPSADPTGASTASAASVPTSPSAASARTCCGPSSSGRCASAAPSTRTGSCCTPSRSSRSHSGRQVQQELLVRMRGEDGQLIMPGEFLPSAERFNLAPRSTAGSSPVPPGWPPTAAWR